VARRGHYVQPAGRSVVPSTIYFPRVQTTMTGGGADFGLTLHSWASATVRRYAMAKVGWEAPQEARFGNPEAMFQWMSERCRKGRTAMIVVP
jgi:hypothetical protein